MTRVPRTQFLLLIFLLSAVFFNAPGAWAFPELVRHGYINCTACHVSPSGGGVLTEYGRALSKELLSATGKDGEEAFAYFVKNPPKWLQLGGDIRTLYLYRDNPTLREGRNILMQADAEVIASYMDKLYAGGTIGVEETSATGDRKIYKPIARRHYINYRPKEEISIRAGKFLPSMGINTADHATVTKRGLGYDEGMETYNLELAYIGKDWNQFVTGIFGRPDSLEAKRERGVSWVGSYAFSERYKIGATYLYGRLNPKQRHLAGIFGILGFSEKLFLLSEADWQFLDPGVASAPKTSGFVSYQKLGYEFVQGFIAFFSQEDSYLNLSLSGSHATYHTVGVEWYPRPHFELNLSWQKQKSSLFDRQYTDMAWFMAHFYL